MAFLPNRRSLLAGLAASSVAAVAIAEQSPNRGVLENKELVELGDSLAGVAERHGLAKDKKDTAFAEAMKQWPDPPEELVMYINTTFGIHDHERDVAGGARYRGGSKDEGKRVISAEYIEEKIAWAKESLASENKRKKPRKTRIEASEGCLAEYRPKLLLAKAYEAECERIKANVNYRALTERAQQATIAFHDHVDAIMDAPAKTMLGVVIKAQALQAWNDAAWIDRVLNVRGTAWADAMSKAVITQAEADL